MVARPPFWRRASTTQSVSLALDRSLDWGRSISDKEAILARQPIDWKSELVSGIATSAAALHAECLQKVL
jgi:hypothetical protein